MQNQVNTEEMNKGSLPLTEINTIVVVHGAWSSANDWHITAAELVLTGNRVITVNLPGHGSDETSVSDISLQLYIYEVLKAIGDEKDITLVGHSFGGIVVKAVADLIAPQIKKIIYLAAYVPQDGDSLLSIAQTDSESLIGKNLIVDEQAGVVGIVKEAVAEIFMADAPESAGATDRRDTRFFGNLCFILHPMNVIWNWQKERPATF
ncbi:alpha/beta fold hydrolase [Dyadobacter sp. MSC1_007]|jgi:pimeloyl-ACP methyl ester carboxylesterase|uniref:alpha/beta fold hydrolase n=1 Tax=Dyadobacter sp. MSC1_007 TaxID=2909264 RepID=UPI00202EA096|nr:alpha/beta hydrolase [Dyadobacter sp. MSC1_007]